jgi:hypothetical protein
VQCSEKFNVPCGQTDADARVVGIILRYRILSPFRYARRAKITLGHRLTNSGKLVTKKRSFHFTHSASHLAATGFQSRY